MRFQVPQFIETEDKIFGPLSFRQFIYLIGGAGLAYLFFELLPFYIAVIPMLLVVGFAAALAFYKINNKPFIGVVQAAFQYFLGSKLYIWKKQQRPIQKREEKEAPQELLIPKLSDSKLKEISWSLGVKDSIYADTNRKRSKPFPQGKGGGE